MASARKLLTIPSEVQVAICEILMRIPVQSDHARQIVNNKVRALIVDLENITFYHHIKFLDKKNYERDLHELCPINNTTFHGCTFLECLFKEICSDHSVTICLLSCGAQSNVHACTSN